MNYNFTLISSKEDCDALVAMAIKNKESLALKKLNLEHKTGTQRENAIGIEADLQVCVAKIAAFDVMLASMAEGPAKKEQMDERTREEYKRFNLANRKESYGVLSILDSESDIGVIEKSIEEIDVFIAGVNDRKAAL